MHTCPYVIKYGRHGIRSIVIVMPYDSLDFRISSLPNVNHILDQSDITCI